MPKNFQQLYAKNFLGYISFRGKGFSDFSTSAKSRISSVSINNKLQRTLFHFFIPTEFSNFCKARLCWPEDHIRRSSSKMEKTYEAQISHFLGNVPPDPKLWKRYRWSLLDSIFLSHLFEQTLYHGCLPMCFIQVQSNTGAFPSLTMAALSSCTLQLPTLHFIDALF